MAMNDLTDDTTAAAPGGSTSGMKPNGRPHSGPVDLKTKADEPAAQPEPSNEPAETDEPTTRGRPRGGVVDL